MLKYLSLFSGIGAFESALTNLGVNYEVVNYCEIDKYASKSYSAIHGIPETKNLWDITKVNVFNLPKPGEIDLVTYGFPCQDISLAGKQKGLFNEDGSLTRSGLFFEALKVIEYCKPKVAIAENVKNLTGKKFATQFETVLKSLEEAGYNNYWKVLNAKDYGIPQNRERVFIVSIRKDVDTEMFEFPKPYSLEKRLKDFLEPHVDEKYYLSDGQMEKIINWKAHQKPFERVNGNNSIVQTLTARGAGEWHSGMIIYSPQCQETSNLQLQIKEATKKGYAEAYDGDGVYINRPHQKRGCVQNGMIQTIKTSGNDLGVVVPQIRVIGNYSPSNHNASRIVDVNGIAPTVKENHGTVTAVNVTESLRIRKLTPKECWRLMGFDDEDFYKAESVNSNTQLYKQAGNSIVVNVLEAIFENLKDILCD